jgi:hypothetical protein
MPARSRAGLLPLMLAIAGCGFQVPGAGPTDTALPSATEAAGPSATPTVAPTPTAVPSATPAPTATPDPFVLDLDAFSCEGGVVLEWSPSLDPDFHHYVALRSPERVIARDYPPIAPAVDWGDSYATDRFVNSAVDASILPSETVWNYRVMAYNARGASIGASAVEAAVIRPRVDLDPLRVGAGQDGATSIAWARYRGPGRCFSAYRLLFSTTGAPSSVLTVVSDQAASAIETIGLHPGVTYQLRLQAVRTTLQGSFVLGETEAVTYTVP